MHKLLHKNGGKESLPEFYRPLELEYKACSASVALSHAAPNTALVLHKRPMLIIFLLIKQATKGSFSAYAYEVLPLMHTLLSHNHLEPGQFANDSLAFLRGFRGHSNALMREFASNSQRGLKGPDAAGTTDKAHSLIKVCRLPSPPATNPPWTRAFSAFLWDVLNRQAEVVMLFTVSWAVHPP